MENLLDITALSRSGAGLGRDPTGRVIFVPFTAPGDQVRVEIVGEEKRYAEGRVTELVKASPQRAEPPCPVFGQCGGCEWQHLPYELQWQTKKEGVLHSLQRVNIELAGLPVHEIPATQIWNYRNRVQLRGFGNELGFYARKSKQVVPIEECFIARKELNERLPAVRETGRSRPREYKVELEVFPTGEVTEAWNQGHSARGFRQVHDEQNARLQSWVAEQLPGGGDVRLLDLYGGSGNLSLGIADRFAAVDCVDFTVPHSPPPGTAPGFRYHRSAVYPWLREQQTRLKNSGPLDAILDPPREGLGPDLFPIVEILRELPLRRVILIGCEPDPWARAVNRLERHGFKVAIVGALDFFPQTHHVEAFAVLEKAPGK